MVRLQGKHSTGSKPCLSGEVTWYRGDTASGQCMLSYLGAWIYFIDSAVTSLSLVVCSWGFSAESKVLWALSRVGSRFCQLLDLLLFRNHGLSNF